MLESHRTVLLVQASARVSRSLTRALAAAFEERWREAHPEDRIIVRDVGLSPPPAISEAWIVSAFTEPDARTAAQRDELKLSDAMIAEVHAADLIVMATPMYNYGMPSALKAWFDQVVRIGQTFTFDRARGDDPLEPMQSGKQLLILSARGEFGFEPGGRRAHMNHLDPHIVVASRYLGIGGYESLAIDYQEFGDERFERSRDAAHAALPDLVARLSRSLVARGHDDDEGSETVAAHTDARAAPR
jgi:FMN-dependent NADH-azoreductase